MSARRCLYASRAAVSAGRRAASSSSREAQKPTVTRLHHDVPGSSSSTSLFPLRIHNPFQFSVEAAGPAFDPLPAPSAVAVWPGWRQLALFAPIAPLPPVAVLRSLPAFVDRPAGHVGRGVRGGRPVLRRPAAPAAPARHSAARRARDVVAQRRPLARAAARHVGLNRTRRGLAQLDVQRGFVEMLLSTAALLNNQVVQNNYRLRLCIRSCMYRFRITCLVCACQFLQPPTC